MPKSMNIEKVKFYPKSLVKKIAAYHLRFFKHRVFEQGKDKDGARFKPYSEKYAELKQRGFQKKKGGRYSSLRGQPIASTKTTPPDFTLTGKTKFATHAYDWQTDSYRIGWRDEHNDTETWKIVKGNKERGRDIVGAPSNEMEKVVNELGDLTEKQMKRIIKNVSIRVG